MYETHTSTYNNTQCLYLVCRWEAQYKIMILLLNLALLLCYGRMLEALCVVVATQQAMIKIIVINKQKYQNKNFLYLNNIKCSISSCKRYKIYIDK